jgi:alkylmercury lyase
MRSIPSPGETMKTGEKKAAREDTYLNKVGQAIKAATPTLDKTDQQIATAVYQLMSRGQPVEATAVAKTVGGVSVDQVNERLDSWPGVFRDDSGRVVGFWGHAIDKLDPEYRLLADGNTTYAWCALDTLFIPGIIGKVVRVEASDPISGEAVSVVVDGDGVRKSYRPALWFRWRSPTGHLATT